MSRKFHERSFLQKRFSITDYQLTICVTISNQPTVKNQWFQWCLAEVGLPCSIIYSGYNGHPQDFSRGEQIKTPGRQSIVVYDRKLTYSDEVLWPQNSSAVVTAYFPFIMYSSHQIHINICLKVLTLLICLPKQQTLRTTCVYLLLIVYNVM